MTLNCLKIKKKSPLSDHLSNVIDSLSEMFGLEPTYNVQERHVHSILEKSGKCYAFLYYTRPQSYHLDILLEHPASQLFGEILAGEHIKYMNKMNEDRRRMGYTKLKWVRHLVKNF